MPEHQKAHDELRKCVKDAHGNKDAIAACEAQFPSAPEGGKVFVTPDGTATMITNGGKVFGGKVF